MIYWFDGDGRIVLASSDETAQSARDNEPGITRMVGPWVDDISMHYVQDRKVRPKPPQPSRHHRFDYPSKTWALDEAAAWKAVRARRNAQLTACDWVVTRAQEQGTAVPQPWLDYRQALRDVTAQADPLNIVWPVAPAA